jgi:hypothetical protein
MDGVILVAKPGTTKLGAFNQALEHLQAVGARVLGVVLNEVNPSSRTYGYYYNRYYSTSSRYHDGGWMGLGRLRGGGPSKEHDRAVSAGPKGAATLLGLGGLLRGGGWSKKHDRTASAEPKAAAALPGPRRLRGGGRTKKHDRTVSAEPEDSAALPGPRRLRGRGRTKKHDRTVSAEPEDSAALPGVEIEK